MPMSSMISRSHLEIAFHRAFVASVQTIIAQVGKQVEDGTVQHNPAALDQFVADCLCEVAFAHAGRADQKNVFGALDKPTGGQVVDLPAVNRGH